MDFEGVTSIAQPPSKVFAAVADLDTYPRWFAVVDRAAAVPADEPTWDVDLAARLGPLKRTKRLRMVRVEASAGDGLVRYERQEEDGRPHGAWLLEAQVTPAAGGSGSELRIHLHYDGVAWVPGLDLLLRQEARRAGARLESLLAGAGP
jgi:uncharacterized protein YndB with AHSA1/START domain